MADGVGLQRRVGYEVQTGGQQALHFDVTDESVSGRHALLQGDPELGCVLAALIKMAPRVGLPASGSQEPVQAHCIPEASVQTLYVYVQGSDGC